MRIDGTRFGGELFGHIFPRKHSMLILLGNTVTYVDSPSHTIVTFKARSIPAQHDKALDALPLGNAVLTLDDVVQVFQEHDYDVTTLSPDETIGYLIEWMLYNARE